MASSVVACAHVEPTWRKRLSDHPTPLRSPSVARLPPQWLTHGWQPTDSTENYRTKVCRPTRALPVLAIVLMLSATSVLANIEETTFFETARDAHIEDVRALIELMGIAANVKSFPEIKNDTTTIEELVDHLIDYGHLIADAKSRRIHRIRSTINPDRDLLSRGLRRWLSEVVSTWGQIDTVTPGSDGLFLPKPYEYHATYDIGKYFDVASVEERLKIPKDPNYYASLVPTKPTRYFVVEKQDPSIDAQSFTVALVDYLIDRAFQEVLSRSFEHSLNYLRDVLTSNHISRTDSELWRELTRYLDKDVLPNDLNSLVLELRSVFVKNMRQLPTRLIKESCEQKSLAPIAPNASLCAALLVLDNIQRGYVPSRALYEANEHPRTCDALALVGIISNE